MDTVVKLYKAAAQHPTPISARILKSGILPGKSVTLVSKWSQRNLERGKSVKFQQYHVFDPASSQVANMLPVDVSNESLSCFSHSDKLHATIREIEAKGSTAQKQYLEIYKHQLFQNYDLGELDLHGQVYTDGTFGSMDWSPCETKLLYIAERKVPKAEPFYKLKPLDVKDTKKGDAEKVPQKGEEYTYKSEWGEQLVGKHQPVVVVCDLESELLSIVDAIPEAYSPGQVIWTPDGKGIVGVAWNNEPRRLGLAFCTNRKSVIFYLCLERKEFYILSEENQAVCSPRFSPDGQYLIWLQRKAGGPHHAGHQLMCCLWESKKVMTLIGLVNEQISTVNGCPFHGIYASELPKRCWSLDSKRILFSTPNLNQVASYVYDIETRGTTKLEWRVESTSQGSGTILDVSQDIIMMVRSSLVEPAGLVMARLPVSGEEHKVEWIPITSLLCPSNLQTSEVSYMSLVAKNSSDSVRNYSAIYIGPQSKPNKSVPLIVYIHGGPHSEFRDQYSLVVELLAALGYGVLMVNFRGSSGQGEDSLNFLPGRVGDADVQDVQEAKQAALIQFPCLNPKKCALLGGSHGGFLVCHLSGQYPDDYCAVVARNPVVDIACMAGITDIPDWCFNEALGATYDPASIMSLEDLAAMRSCSPIQHVLNVKAPTLLLLGKNDLRVPCSQGLMYYHTLHANGITAKVHLYEDVHSLSNVPVEMDNTINFLLWFEEHIG